MNLRDKLIKETILVPMQAIRKGDAIQELLSHLRSLDILSETVKLLENIKEQEKIITSSAGRGIAYHYSTSIEIDDMIAVLGVSKAGIDYHASDGLSCNFILLILEPQSKEESHRHFIHCFQDMIRDISIKEKLLDASTNVEIEQIIKAWEDQLSIDTELL